jgi:hypothetical protein
LQSYGLHKFENYFRNYTFILISLLQSEKYCMKKIIIIVLVLCSLQLKAQDKAAVQILANLKAQQMAWNAGSIENYMQHYWKTDSLLFISQSGAEYGWQTVRDNYLKFYPDQASLGQLQFKILHTLKISKTCYNVVGKWDITSLKGKASGYFTQLWKKINGAWVIVQDHT